MASRPFHFSLYSVIMFSLMFSLRWSELCAEDRESLLPFQGTSRAVRLGIEAVSSFLNEKRGHVISSMLFNSKKVKLGASHTDTKFLAELLKSMGIDSEKLSDFAFGGLIFLVRMVSQILAKSQNDATARKQRQQEGFSIFHFLVEQPQVAVLMDMMKDSNLIDSLLEEVEPNSEESLYGDEHCVLALLCKTEPFVKGMQKSLQFFSKRNNGKSSCRLEKDFHEFECKEDLLWENSSVEERLYFFGPPLEDVVDRGQECDLRFPNCSY